MTTSAILGLDIGGANLKAALVRACDVACLTQPFALWRNPAGLADALTDLLRRLPPADEFAVTMTGELCDCFPGKREGVRHILDSVERIAEGRPVRVWCTDGRFRDAAAARAAGALLVAASNWLALATRAARQAPEAIGLLLDVGSTTTDIIPLSAGVPVPSGRTDPARLASGELVYRGVRRTPVCALLGARVAAEWFATSHDVHLVLGEVVPDPLDCETADGRPATPEHAHARLARMLGADLASSSEEERLCLAHDARRQMIADISRGIERVLGRLADRPSFVILAGSGEFLARAVLRETPSLQSCAVRSLAESLGASTSTAACAHAVAVLAREKAP